MTQEEKAKIHPSDFDCGTLSICKELTTVCNELMNFLDTIEVKKCQEHYG